MKNALAELASIRARIARAGHCVVMLDFDGTLAPIVADPRGARMDARMRRALAAVARRFPVAIITGRSLAFIRSHIRMQTIAFAGNHGFEYHVKGVTRSTKIPAKIARSYNKMETEMRALVQRFPGTILEDKQYTISLHYRHADRRTHAAIRAKVHAAARASGNIRLIDGVLVYNILPAVRRDKGTAARFMLDRLGRRMKSVPIFIGDDHTDEDAFKAVRRGIGIRVGKNSTSDAHYYVRNQSDVVLLLEALAGPL